MKIGIEITPLTARPTGIGYYTRHLLEALSALPEAPELVGFASGMAPPQLDRLSLPHRWLPMPTRALYQLWNTIKWPRADQLLRGIQIYHGVNYVLPPLKKAAGVLTIHDLSFLIQPEWSSPKIVAPFCKAVTHHARKADRIIVPSEATKTDAMRLLHLPEEKLRVIPLAGDPTFVPLCREDAEKTLQEKLGISGDYFLCVGTLEPRKNLSTLLHAFLKTDLPHKLVFVGGQGWGDQLLAEHPVSEKDLQRLVFTGYLEDRSLFPALYSRASAFLFPSWYEGFGLPLVEAMACACPVISSNSSSLPEVGGDAVLYAAPENEAAWTEAMERLAANPVLEEKLRKEGLERAQQFSWEKTGRATYRCYEECL